MPKRRVGELMNPDVVTLRPDATVQEAQKLLSRRRVSTAPVVDERGHVLGVVSLNDLARHQAEEQTTGEAGLFFSSLDEYRDLARIPANRGSTPIEKLMRRRVYSVSRDAGVAVAANIMRERCIQRLLVTEKSVLVGVIRSLDLLRIVEEAC